MRLARPGLMRPATGGGGHRLTSAATGGGGQGCLGRTRTILASGPEWGGHFEGGDADGYGAALLGGAEEGTGGGAFGLDDVIGVVGEGLAGLQVGELADDAVALDD